MIAIVRLLCLFAIACSLVQAQTQAQIRRAVNRALVPIQRSVNTFVEKRACVSCHHNSLAIMTLRGAQGRGAKVDAAVISKVEEKTFRELTAASAVDAAIESRNFADPTPNQSLLLMAASAAGMPSGDALKIYAARIAHWQQPDGHWATSDFRPPHSFSVFTATATALSAIRAYGTQPEPIRTRARQWLSATPAQSTEDASFRLMGLVAAEADPTQIESAARDLTALQLAGGGWPQLPGYAPDAYSTGEAVYALSEAGQLESARRRGLRFLLSTQAPDGTWRTHTRMLSPASVSPPYFETGFPYKRDQFLSFAGSCWAVRALSAALPLNLELSRLFSPPAPKPASFEAALWGDASQLTQSLEQRDGSMAGDSSLTPLMLAAGPVDSEAKVRVLLARGANVKARTKSGTDALTIAATYRGNSPTLKLLLDAGAEPNLPKDSKVRHSAIDFAAMSGDLEAVKLLLSRGADPNAGSPLSSAITFGHPDVVEALINAGADVDLVEGTGINLLHWATITNRPGAIPRLAKAKVPINAMDDNGFTPLHYAASIDFGNTQVLDALLAAGADPKARDFDERTPLQQAIRLHHTALAKALRGATKR